MNLNKEETLLEYILEHEDRILTYAKENLTKEEVTNVTASMVIIRLYSLTRELREKREVQEQEQNNKSSEGENKNDRSNE